METSPGAPPAPPPLEAPQNGRRTAPAGGSSDCRRWRGVCLGRKGVPRGSGLETVDESGAARSRVDKVGPCPVGSSPCPQPWRSRSRSEEHTSELQSRGHLVCRLLLEKKKKA